MRQYFLLPLVAASLFFPLFSVQVNAEVSVLAGTSVSDNVSTAIDLCINSTSPVDQEVVVEYAIIDGTAIEGEDFTLNVSDTGNITIPVNESMACLEGAVSYIVDDQRYENDQNYIFEITGPNVTGGLSSTEYVILDTTGAPDVVFSMSMYMFNETDSDTTYEVEVTTGMVLVEWPAVVTSTVVTSTVAAYPDSAEMNDFSISPNTTVTITNGSNVDSFEIMIIADDVYEGDEIITAMLNSGDAIILIQDDQTPPVVTVNAPPALFKNSGPAELCAVTDVFSEQPIVVDYWVFGNEAEIEKDFIIPSGANGNVTINPMMTQGCIEITVVDDPVFEGNETITFTLLNSSIGTIGTENSVTIHIVDNEEPPVLTLTSRTYVAEGTVEDLIICVNVSVPSAFGIGVSYQFVGGSASESDDYEVHGDANGTLMFRPMTTSDCLAVSITDDVLYEGDEQFTFTLSNAMNATLGIPNEVTITIIDNDSPVVSVEPLPSPVEESSGNITVCVNLSNPSVLENIVSFSVTDDSATSPEDYMVPSGSIGNLTFDRMATSECTTIIITDDMVYEESENFEFSLTSTSVGTLDDQNSSITIVIEDDEEFPFLSIQSLTEVDESQGQFDVCVVTNVSSSFLITVSCNVTDISATLGEDYILPNELFRLEPMETQTCLPFNVSDDVEYEGDEMFELALINPTNAMLGDPSSLTITIVENDPSPSPSESPTTESPTTESTQADSLLYIIIGVVAGAVVAALVFLFLIIIIIICCRVNVNRQGFYVTDEDKGEAPQMLRYSASLRSISSQTVIPVDNRNKENEYMV